MEAVRPTRYVQLDDTNDLPPPPAPFPTELLPTASPAVSVDSTFCISGHTADVYLPQPPSILQSLTAVEDSCIRAFRTLLPTSASHLTESESQLVSAVSELLEVAHELETFHTASTLHVGAASPALDESTESPYAILSRHLEELQTVASQRADVPQLQPAVDIVREEIAWARIHSLSNAVLGLMCLEENATGNGLGAGPSPPDYTQSQIEKRKMVESDLPSYDDHADASVPFVSKAEVRDTSQPTTRQPDSPNEKMIRELDAVTQAIERLYDVTPQYHDQRVELKPAVAPSTPSPSLLKAKRAAQEKEREKHRELEAIWKQIERAHGKMRIKDQRVDMEGWEERRAARRENYLDHLAEKADETRLRGQDGEITPVNADLARARELRARDHFLRDLIEQSADRRLGNQDSNSPLSLPVGDADKQRALISSIVSRVQASRLASQDYPFSVHERLTERRASLIENMVEFSSNGRLNSQDSLPPTPSLHGVKEDPFELVTVQDFLASKRASAMEQTSSAESSETMQRSRSNSAPLGDDGKKGSTALKKFAGFVRRGSLVLGLKASGGSGQSSARQSRAHADGRWDVDLSDVAYIAEHQENLRSVQIMIQGAGSSPDYVLETEVSTAEGVDEAVLVSRKDPSVSSRITLPTLVRPGQSAALLSTDLSLEGKLAALPTTSSGSISSLNTHLTHALSSPELRDYQPRSLECAICHHRIADLAGERIYKDLPSEHWAEMMEIWMCHNDPSFTAQLAKHTKDGFWPTAGTILVGSSYLLVHSSEIDCTDLVVQNAPNVSDLFVDFQSLLPPCNLRAIRRPSSFPLTVSSPYSQDGRTVETLASFDGPFPSEAGARQESLSLLADTTCPKSRPAFTSNGPSASEINDLCLERHRAETTPEATFRHPATSPFNGMWRSVTCSCGEVLGKKRFEDGKIGHGTFKLDKWAVGFSKADDSPLRYPLSVFILSELLELAQAHASYRFIVADEETSERRLLIWLFNPSIGISYRQSTRSPLPSPLRQSFSDKNMSRRQSSSSVVPSSRTMRVAKIFYKVIDDHFEVENLPGFGVSGQTENLSYSHNVCSRLIQALKDSSALYPISKRQMGAFDIGFLERS
ncbi:ubiquitin-protein ligase E3 D, partial [Tremellales sp. Uapishka_1]